MKRAVLTDFDGTVTRTDVIEDLLEAFAPRTWRDIEALHRSRSIGTRETLVRQLALLHTTEEDLLRFVDAHVLPDEGFAEFVAFCREKGLRLEIVSEGLDFYLEFLLRKWRLTVPVRTNHAIFVDERVGLSHPWADATCTLCGTCKLLRLFQLRTEGYKVAYVGDGHSDLCPAVEADLVFAKSDLVDLCREEGIDFIPFETFADVQREIGSWR